MIVLFLDWNCYGKTDVIDALKKLGYEIELFPLTKEAEVLGLHNRYIESVSDKLREDHIDFVFSINYFPNISEACERCGCKYISWIYDSPYNKVYSINIINPCNYIFTFDRQMYLDLSRQFVKTVYYAPLAVNVDRLNTITLSPQEQRQYRSDISFVGALYDEDHNNYEELLALLEKKEDTYSIGYIDGLIEAQRKIYGYNFLSKALAEKPKVLETVPESLNDTTQSSLHFTSLPQAYANHILCRKIATIERKELLTLLSSHFETKIYTRNSKAKIGQCINCGYINYTLNMPKVFKASKINLNITLRSIQTGIPLRALDIMGAGGFLLTNYQEDFLLHFEPDVDFVYYSSKEELLEKASFYLSHETERKKIARNGHQKMTAHTYIRQISQMISIAFPE